MEAGSGRDLCGSQVYAGNQISYSLNSGGIILAVVLSLMENNIAHFVVSFYFLNICILVFDSSLLGFLIVIDQPHDRQRK
jgi:hypothetical protein